MNEIEGDLLKLAREGAFDVIIHGCNCYCQMGKGIALSIKTEFPQAYSADVSTEKGSKAKLGTYSSASAESNGHIFTIVNAYTQYDWRGKGVKTDYSAIKEVMVKIKQDFSGKRIGYPLIGAGLAGGDWAVISSIIGNQLSGEDHTLVKYKPYQNVALDSVQDDRIAVSLSLNFTAIRPAYTLRVNVALYEI